MLKRTFSVLMLTLLLGSTLTLAFRIQPVKAIGTIYIRTDGSIDPPTAPITTADNITYTLTGDITSDGTGIVIERDNIVLDGAGYAITGSGDWYGITLTSRSNVTVRNMRITNFSDGIDLYLAFSNALSGNTFTANNGYGIRLDSCSGTAFLETT